MSDSNSPNQGIGSPSTPQAVIPDLYAGISSSFSSQFLNANIAFPSMMETTPLSPTMRYTFGYTNPMSPSLDYPYPPSLINIYTPYSDKKSKAKRQLSAKEFNDLFSGQVDSPTKLRRSASIIKRKLQYFGTVEHFDQPGSSSSSVPCTPVRYAYEVTYDSEIRNMYAMNVTPVRYQYRLHQMRNRRAILLRSPLRNKVDPAVSRNLLKSFDESTRSSYPSLPKAVENLGDYSIHSLQATSNDYANRIKTENSSDSTLSTEGESVGSLFEYVGTNGGFNRHYPEVLLDCDGTMISMKEVSLDTLLSIKRRMNPKNKEMENVSHFTL